MELDISELFARWKGKKIKQSEIKKLDRIFANRKKGKIYTGRQTWAHDQDEILKFRSLIRNGRPTAALYGNVLWDLTTLNRETVFSSVQETFLETVKFFIDHPEYNLIVKPHPGELIWDHESREKLTDLIKARFPEIPENILVLHPKSSITVYDLIPATNLSIVYTTTTGIESVILGTPTIALGKVHYRGKGFTYDPSSPAEFYEILTSILEDKVKHDLAGQREEAAKYYYLYFFAYFHDYGIIEFDLHEKTRLIPKSLRELLAIKDFNLVAEAMINRQLIPYFDEGLEEL